MARRGRLLARTTIVRAVEALLLEDTVDGFVGRRGRGARLARGRGVTGRRALVRLTLLLLFSSGALLRRASHGEEIGWLWMDEWSLC